MTTTTTPKPPPASLLLDNPDALLTHVNLFPTPDRELAAMILDQLHTPDTTRPWESYDHHLFSWDVSCWRVDLDLRNLHQRGLSMGIDTGVFRPGIPRSAWFGRMRQAVRVWREAMNQDALFGEAVEDARAEFASPFGHNDGRPDHDSWNFLPDGTRTGAKFTFQGRCGRHLVLTEWDYETIQETTLYRRDQIECNHERGLREFVENEFPDNATGRGAYRSLVSLWWYLHDISRSLRDWPPHVRVEERAAWIIFACHHDEG